MAVNVTFGRYAPIEDRVSSGTLLRSRYYSQCLFIEFCGTLYKTPDASEKKNTKHHLP